MYSIDVYIMKREVMRDVEYMFYTISSINVYCGGIDVNLQFQMGMYYLILYMNMYNLLVVFIQYKLFKIV